ncbi:hypothetical protein Lal_00008572 [Lupinus albus]|nr:hypothetical protein Lal_00008572 [Lupinus albus]
MCPHKNLFTTFENVDIGVFLMGNNTRGRDAEIYIVHIKTDDDVVRNLANAYYTPYLKRNLISLGTLESLGCTYSIEG